MKRRVLFTVAASMALAWVACKGVDFTAPTGAKLDVRANPLTIPLSGGSSSISVSIIKDVGIPVADGTVVRYSTSLGEIDPVSETTDGLTSAVLRSTGISGTATVTAFSGSVMDTVDVTIGVTADSLALNATPANLPTGGGTVDLVATVFGSNASPVAGATVAFSTDAGSLNSAGNPVTTDSDGVARDTLTTTSTAMVTARSGLQSAMATINVGTVGMVTVLLSADQVNLPSGGGTVSLVAVVLGDSGPVPDVAVAWSASAGDLSDPGITLTDLNGEARNSLFTTTNATVTASASSATDDLLITVGSTVTPVISISAQRSSIPLVDQTGVDNCDPAVSTIPSLPIDLFAQVEDGDGNPVPSREVTFFVEFGQLADCGRVFGKFCESGSNVVTALTDSRGIATVSYSMDDDDINFCNCLPSVCLTAPPPVVGECVPPATCANVCRINEDLFCQVAISAVSGGVFSDNIQFIEYGR